MYFPNKLGETGTAGCSKLLFLFIKKNILILSSIFNLEIQPDLEFT